MEPSADVGLTDTPRKLSDLPKEHLFRLIYRLQADGVDHRPVDWPAVESRLATHQEEAKEWIETINCSKKLFLHQFSSFNFGAGLSDRGLIHWLPIDGDLASRIMLRVIEIYPEALTVYDGSGLLPIHLVFQRYISHDGSTYGLQWTSSTESIIHLIYQHCPESFKMVTLTNGSSVLSFLLEDECFYSSQATVTDADEAKNRVQRFLLDIFPEACQISRTNGEYPLHLAARNGMSHKDIEEILCMYPQAAESKAPATPLLEFLGKFMNEDISDEGLKVASFLLDASPWSAAMDDKKVLWWKDEEGMQPSGDALDYLCLKYCDHVGVDFYDLIPEDAGGYNGHDDNAEFRKGYIEANINFLSSTKEKKFQHDYRGVLWTFLLKVLRAMYGKEPFLPLHAAMHRRLCRPWNLVVLHGLLFQYPHNAKKRDTWDNLPIHGFLESSLVEQGRAIERYYAGNEEDYNIAVKHALAMLLEAYPEGSREPNGSRRYPIHLAIDTSRSSLSHTVLVDQILVHAAATLLKRDVRTELYPFAAAAVGSRGDLDLTFCLLRQDPSALEASLLR